LRSLLNCRASGFVQSRSQGLFSGKSSYGKTPLPDSKSTAWEFFTDDYVFQPVRKGALIACDSGFAVLTSEKAFAAASLS
jgi:hypothetical protein